MEADDRNLVSYSGTGEHYMTNWARYIVSHWGKEDVSNAIKESEFLKGLFSNDLTNEQRVNEIVKVLDGADKTDLEFGLIPWPTKDDMQVAFLWWHSGGKEEWNGSSQAR